MLTLFIRAELSSLFNLYVNWTFLCWFNLKGHSYFFAAGCFEDPTAQRCWAGGGGYDRGPQSGRPGEMATLNSAAVCSSVGLQLVYLCAHTLPYLCIRCDRWAWFVRPGAVSEPSFCLSGGCSDKVSAVTSEEPTALFKNQLVCKAQMSHFVS